MHMRSWSALLLALALSACHGERNETPQTPAQVQPAKRTTPPATEEGIRGTVLGEAFFADQILLRDHAITFRQGKDFFADRAVNISVFPDELAAPGMVTHATVKLAHRPDGSSLPKDEDVRAIKLRLVMGPAESLGAEVEIELETDGPSPTRIVGRGYATYKDIRVWKDAVDLNWDSFDTLRHVAQLYLQRAHGGAQIETSNEFGMRIDDPGDDHSFKTAFIGYELMTGVSSKGLTKLQLVKNEAGWEVANELPADQINEAHPLQVSIDPTVTSGGPEAVAARALELKLQKQQLMPRVRGTHVGCYVGQKEARGSCDTAYELTGTFGIRCHGQNFRMEYADGKWTVAGEIGLHERVDYRTGKVVSHEPSNFGCRGGDVTQST
jgi:hypothetical protein